MYIYLSDVPYILVFFCTSFFHCSILICKIVDICRGKWMTKKMQQHINCNENERVLQSMCLFLRGWVKKQQSIRVSEYQSIMLTHHDWNDDNDNVNIDINYNTICNSLLSISDKNHSFIIFFPKPYRKSPKITKTDCKKLDISSRIST